MKRWIAAALLVGAAVLSAPQPAACTYCPDILCMGSCGNPDCACLFPPGSPTGECWGVRYAPNLIAKGWSTHAAE